MLTWFDAREKGPHVAPEQLVIGVLSPSFHTSRCHHASTCRRKAKLAKESALNMSAVTFCIRPKVDPSSTISSTYDAYSHRRQRMLRRKMVNRGALSYLLQVGRGIHAM